MQSYVHWAAAGAVGLFFIVNGAVELPKWRRQIQAFERWGYPRYWPLVTYLLKILFGVLVFVPGLQLIGLAGAGLILLAAVATLAFHREKDTPKAAVGAVVILAVAGLAAATSGD